MAAFGVLDASILVHVRMDERAWPMMPTGMLACTGGISGMPKHLLWSLKR
jgi:hypothetical protein